MRSRAIICLVIGLILMGIGVGVTAGTAAFVSRFGGIVVVYVGAFISGIGFLIRSAFYCAMSQSQRET